MVLCIDSELNHILKVIIGAIIFLAILFFSTNSFAAEIFVEASDQSAVRIPGVTITLDACTISRDYNITTSVQTMHNCAVGYYRFYLKNLNYLGGSVTSVSWYFYNISAGTRTIYDGRTEHEGATGYYIDIYIPDGGAEYAMHGFVNFMANDGTSYSFRFGNAQVGHPNMQAYLAHYHTEGAAATCTTAQTCTKCGTTLQAALGHSMGSWYVSVNETCTAKGQNRRDCQRSGCSYYEVSERAALGHDYSTSWTTNASNHWHKCTRCSATTGNGAHVDSDKNGLCDTCGYRMYYIISVPSAVTGLVYNGQQKTGVSTGTGYNITGNTATNAGDYTATCSLQSGYRWTGAETGNKTVSWSIAKANGYISLSATNGRVRYGTASKTFTVSSHHGGALSVSDNHGTATCSVSGTTVTVSSLSGISCGANESVCPTITITVISAATTNYKQASATYTLKIIDDVAPTGSISVNNTSTMKNGKKAVKMRNITLAITYSDAGSSVDKMAVFEQTSNVNSILENTSTSKSFTLSTGDGEKTVYLVLRDTWGNLTAIPTN